ncbi:MAG TPA: GNAT family N-acetyltransferase [Burkholderiaceae bacterium]
MKFASGRRVTLRRAVPSDRQRAYRCLTDSDLTPRLFGAPLFGDRPVPGFVGFSERFGARYFDGSRPYEGRGAVIGAAGGDVGFLAWHRIDLLRDVVELDVWLAAERHCGQGIASEAIDLACLWLQAEYGVNRFLMRPSRRNLRGLRALRRAGFRETDLDPAAVERDFALPPADYCDACLLFRILPLPLAMPMEGRGRTLVFVDSEFTDLTDPALISLGAVTESGATFYAELNGWEDASCSPFVRSVVLPLLGESPQPRPAAAAGFRSWLEQAAGHRPLLIVSDSGFDRWALVELFGDENLPSGAHWQRVPIAYEELDRVAQEMRLRRHHALDDALALRRAVLGEKAVERARRQDREAVAARAGGQRQ